MKKRLIVLFNFYTFVTFLFFMLTLISRENMTDKFKIDSDRCH